MQFFVFENSRAIMATEDQVYITRFLYSFTKDNLARYTKKCSLARKDLQHIIHVRVHLCKSLTLDLIFRFFNHFVLCSESYQGIYACCVSCYTQGKIVSEGKSNRTHTHKHTDVVTSISTHTCYPLLNKNVTCESLSSLNFSFF